MSEIMIYTQAQPLTVKEYQGQRVITFKDVDALHQRPAGTARRNFNANRRHFIEGEDFFTTDQPNEIRTLGIKRPQGGTPESVTLLTKMGYLMLVKSFTDDLAWMIQRQLVKNYFEAQGMTTLLPTTLEQTPAHAATSDLPTIFLQAIQQAIDSGLYYIRPRYKHMVSDIPDGMEPFGVYDRNDIYLLSQTAYKIYAAAVSNPVPIRNLWFELSMSGTIIPRKQIGHICVIQGSDRKVIGLRRDKLRIPTK